MAKAYLHPIGSPLAEGTDEATYRANRERMEALNRRLRERRERSAAAGARPTSSACTPREAHHLGADRTPQGPRHARLSHQHLRQLRDTFGDPPRTSPAAGVITAVVRVEDRLAVVIANDNTVASAPGGR